MPNSLRKHWNPKNSSSLLCQWLMFTTWVQSFWQNPQRAKRNKDFTFNYFFLLSASRQWKDWVDQRVVGQRYGQAHFQKNGLMESKRLFYGDIVLFGAGLHGILNRNLAVKPRSSSVGYHACIRTLLKLFTLHAELTAFLRAWASCHFSGVPNCCQHSFNGGIGSKDK